MLFTTLYIVAISLPPTILGAVLLLLLAFEALGTHTDSALTQSPGTMPQPALKGNEFELPRGTSIA